MERIAGAALLGAALLLAWRRLVGGLQTPPEWPAMLLLAIVAASLVVVCTGPRWRPWLAATLIGLSLCLPGVSAAALFAYALPLAGVAALERSRWLPIAPRLSVSRRQERSSLERSSLEHRAQEQSPAQQGNSADVLQQVSRRRTDRGEDCVVGFVRVALAVGQRSAAVHVAFCPPFERQPALTSALAEGLEARVQAGLLYPHGARLDLKLPRPAAAAAQVCVSFEFIAPRAEANQRR